MDNDNTQPIPSQPPSATGGRWRGSQSPLLDCLSGFLVQAWLSSMDLQLPPPVVDTILRLLDWVEDARINMRRDDPESEV